MYAPAATSERPPSAAERVRLAQLPLLTLIVAASLCVALVANFGGERRTPSLRPSRVRDELMSEEAMVEDIQLISQEEELAECLEYPHLELKSVSHSNLGGFGPDEGEEGLVYHIRDTKFNEDYEMVIHALNKDYRPYDPKWIGKFNHYEAINMMAGGRLEASFTFRDKFTKKPVTVPEMELTFFDLDEESPGLGAETLDFHGGWSHYDVVKDSALKASEDQDGLHLTFQGTTSGTRDSPGSVEQEDNEQAAKTVSISFKNVHSFEVTISATRGYNARFFYFITKPSLLCRAAVHPEDAMDETDAPHVVPAAPAPPVVPVEIPAPTIAAGAAQSPPPSKASTMLYWVAGLVTTGVTLVVCLLIADRKRVNEEVRKFTPLLCAQTEDSDKEDTTLQGVSMVTEEHLSMSAQAADAALARELLKAKEEAEAAEVQAAAAAEAAEREKAAAEAAEKERVEAEILLVAAAETAAKAKAKGKAKAGAKKKPQEADIPKAFFTFETPKGEEKTVEVKQQPIGFVLKGTKDGLLIVKQVHANGEKLGVKVGWVVRQFHSKGAAPHIMAELTDSVKRRSKLVEVVSLLPRVAPVIDNIIVDEGQSEEELGPAWTHELEVTVVSARGLRDADWAPGGGGSDPYVTCQVQGHGKSTFKTKTIDNQNSPTWNETGKITDFQTGDSLNFVVNDKDFGKSDDLLGRISLQSDKILPSGFKGELKLNESSDNAKVKVDAYLTVNVKVTRRFRSPPPLPPPPQAPKAKAKAKAKAN